MISNCNCAEKIECGCELEFDYYETGTTSVLTVGSLVDVSSASSCDIEGYVIDWYLDDVDSEVQFTTGIGNDPDIVYNQPFIGIESIPVVGGTWIPVIRYIVIDGVKVFTTPHSCQKWCDMTINLPEIEVNNFTCSSSTGPYGVYYTHQLQYNCLVNNIEKAGQVVRFDLDNDGTVTDFAWKFTGYTVGDRIEIIYCDIDNNEIEILEDWVIGTEVVSDLTSVPKKLGMSDLRRVIHLPSYTLGDYLKIRITPSYISGNPLTNWVLLMKCFHNNFTCLSTLNFNMQSVDIDTIEISEDSANCYYEVHFHTLETPQNPNSYDVGKYMSWYQIWTGQGSDTSFYDGQVTFYIYQERIVGNFAQTANFGSCVNQNDHVTIAKVGTQLKFTFEDGADYTDWKTSYNTLLANSHWTDYSSDGTDILHYKFFRIDYLIAEGCGDPFSVYDLLISYDSVFTWDDINYILTIDLAEDVNEYVDEDCSNTYEQISTWVGYVHNTYVLANFSRTTKIRYTNPLLGVYLYENALSAQSAFTYYESFVFYAYSYDPVNGPCPLFEQSFVQYSGTASAVYMFITAQMRIVFTSESDPVNNWKAYRVINEDGVLYTNSADYVLIKEVSGGVQIYP
jgi:hypothetical protein